MLNPFNSIRPGSLLLLAGIAMATLILAPARTAKAQDATAPIGGLVTNDEGVPLADVVVNLQWTIPGQNGPAGARSAQVKTDAAGRWTLANVPQAAFPRVNVSLTHDGYPRKTLRMPNAVQMAGLGSGIVLSKAVDLAGVLVDGDGKPIVGGMVTAGPSALSHNDFRVNGFQFDAGVADFELPVHAALPGVAALVPCDGFRSQ